MSVFIGVFALMAVLEAIMPKKRRVMPRLGRWITNLSLVVIDGLVVRLLVPILAVGVAVWAAEQSVGLFNLLELPIWIEFALAIILLDVLIYAQHVASHKIPVLWRLHKVHHADRDIDVTTGARFHPLEIVLSMLFKLLCVVLLGASAAAVIVFEVLLNGAAMFNHANVSLPKALDSVMRKLIVTPDFHRVHHSVVATETNSNYGFFLSCWDRLFRTYTAQPSSGHEAMTIGLSQYQSEQPNTLWWSLKVPFVKRRKSQNA